MVVLDKTVLCQFSLFFGFTYIHKKAGQLCCCSANRGSRIAYLSEQATLSPTLYAYVHAQACIIYTYHEHPCRNVLDKCLNLRDSYSPKQSALDAFLQYVTAFLRCRCQRQGLLQTFATAKVQHFFDMYKFICKNHKKICTFDADLWILGSYQFLWG